MKHCVCVFFVVYMHRDVIKSQELHNSTGTLLDLLEQASEASFSNHTHTAQREQIIILILYQVHTKTDLFYKVHVKNLFIKKKNHHLSNIVINTCFH